MSKLLLQFEKAHQERPIGTENDVIAAKYFAASASDEALCAMSSRMRNPTSQSSVALRKSLALAHLRTVIKTFHNLSFCERTRAIFGSQLVNWQVSRHLPEDQADGLSHTRRTQYVFEP